MRYNLVVNTDTSQSVLSCSLPDNHICQVFCCLMREKYLYLFATRSQLQTDTKKSKKKWRGGLKESIKLMLIIASKLQFFKDGINLRQRIQNIIRWKIKVTINIRKFTNVEY